MDRPSIDQQITFLYTRDMATTARFYENGLGLSLVLDQGGCRIYRVCSGAFLGICERHNAPIQSIDDHCPSVILTLVTDEVDAWYDRLSTKGIIFEKAPAINAAYGIYHCFLRDPNGYLIEIQRFLDAEWSGRR
jgi:catechol 2,3-dioxygenase-like lactoylglutathione lyase family enzyme